jgi:enolase-phosphatase E1
LAPLGSAARALLLDVEGTTTPVSFVYETLFPYARTRLEEFVTRHAPEDPVRADLALLREDHAADRRAGLAPPAWEDGEDPASAARYALWLMDADRKATGLKALQGHIWEHGYARGDLRGAVYEDVPRAFRRWRAQGKEIAIFSSGSVLAQRLLFAHSSHGDLTPYLRAYFDTSTGAKRDPESYRHIAAALGPRGSEVLFVSDVGAELDAARDAGMATALCMRAQPPPAPSTHAVVTSFDALSR